MGRTKKLKVTPVIETGMTLEFKPGQAPVPKTCHLTLRWAVEKCPICASSLMMYYTPTIKHKAGMEAKPGEEHRILVSCVGCGFLVVDELDILKKFKPGELGIKPRKNIGEV
jgi:hypothetical protein